MKDGEDFVQQLIDDNDLVSRKYRQLKADLRKIVEEMKPYHDNSCICERCEWHEELSDKVDELLEGRVSDGQI